MSIINRTCQNMVSELVIPANCWSTACGCDQMYPISYPLKHIYNQLINSNRQTDKNTKHGPWSVEPSHGWFIRPLFIGLELRFGQSYSLGGVGFNLGVGLGLGFMLGYMANKVSYCNNYFKCEPNPKPSLNLNPYPTLTLTPTPFSI